MGITAADGLVIICFAAGSWSCGEKGAVGARRTFPRCVGVGADHGVGGVKPVPVLGKQDASHHRASPRDAQQRGAGGNNKLSFARVRVWITCRIQEWLSRLAQPSASLLLGGPRAFPQLTRTRGASCWVLLVVVPRLRCHPGSSCWTSQWRRGRLVELLRVLLPVARALCGCWARTSQPAPPLLVHADPTRQHMPVRLLPAPYTHRNSGEPSDLSLKRFYYISLQISFLYDHQLLIFFVSLSVLYRASKSFTLAKDVMIFSAKQPVVSYSRNFSRMKSETANGSCRICSKRMIWDWKQCWFFFLFP